MPFGRPFRAISLCVSFPGLKPWAVSVSPVGRLELAQENVQTPEALRACITCAKQSLRDKSHSPIEAPHNYLSAYGVNSALNYLGPAVGWPPLNRYKLWAILTILNSWITHSYF